MLETTTISELEQQLETLEINLISRTKFVDSTVLQHEAGMFSILSTLVSTAQALVDQPPTTRLLETSTELWMSGSSHPVLKTASEVALLVHDTYQTLCGQCDSLCSATDIARKYLQSTCRDFLTFEDNSQDLHKRFSASSYEARQSLKAKENDVLEKSDELKDATWTTERRNADRELIAHKREKIKAGRTGMRAVSCSTCFDNYD